MTSLGLYAVAGLFWIPVIFMQIEMRDLARAAVSSSQPLPPRYFALFRRWFLFGIPGFGSVMIILWLMIAKPNFSVMSELTAMRKILVLGASGLIGRFVTDDLRARGFGVVAIARRFPPSQRTNALDLEMPILSMDPAALARLIRDHDIDVAVNCLGVLQDGPGSDTGAVHRDFVERLLQAIGACGRAFRLIQISIPGAATTIAPPSARPSARPSG